MNNPLIALRLALPGEPSLRDLAKRIGISYEMLRKFEEGHVGLGADNIEAYAKLVRCDVAEVTSRFEKVRIDWLKRQIKESEQRLAGHIATPRPRGRKRKVG